MEYTYHYHSPLGGMTLAGNGEVLTGLSFDRPENILREAPEGQTEKSLPVFTETVRWLDLYFSGRDPGFTPKLRPEGTAFARAVWKILLTIPYGRTMTYGQIAEQIAGQTGVRRMSAQAVGGAVGRNPIALIIPCHRVIGADGSLTGYAAGIDRKEKLLRMEAAE